MTGQLFYAPLGTDPDDGGWIPLGTTVDGSGWSMSVDPDGSGLMEAWSKHLLRKRTVCFSWPLRAMSWRTYRLLFGRTHPAARRAHMDYSRRLRARRKRRRG